MLVAGISEPHFSSLSPAHTQHTRTAGLHLSGVPLFPCRPAPVTASLPRLGEALAQPCRWPRNNFRRSLGTTKYCRGEAAPVGPSTSLSWPCSPETVSLPFSIYILHSATVEKKGLRKDLGATMTFTGSPRPRFAHSWMATLGKWNSPVVGCGKISTQSLRPERESSLA